MTAAALLALIIVGFAVGFLAGLVGIGGGVLIIPFLYFFYDHAAWSGLLIDPALHATVAHATSLFIIVPTAVVGTLTYARVGLVAWRAAVPIALFSMVAAMAAALLAARVPPELLKLCFGTFLVFTAVQMVRRRGPAEGLAMRRSLPLFALTGIIVGVLSALLGVGGGLVAIPLLMYVVRLEVGKVAATSLAIVAFAAAAGTITYMASGAAAGVELAGGNIGFVHFAAAVPMLPGAMLAARWGAKLNQRIDAMLLRRLFAVLFLIIGVRLVITNMILLLQP